MFFFSGGENPLNDMLFITNAFRTSRVEDDCAQFFFAQYISRENDKGKVKLLNIGRTLPFSFNSMKRPAIFP